MKLSPLNTQHLALGAKMADFGGWLMPIDYPATGTIIEHTAVRERVGIFDVSHLGKASVKGPGALKFLNTAFTNDLNRIEDGQAQYTMLCNESGGVIDDLIVYRNNDDDLLLVPNAANTADVVAALKKMAPEDIEIINLHEKYGVIAVQGPEASAVIAKLGIVQDLEYMSFDIVTIEGLEVILCRTGYTGEKGFELLPLWEDAEKIWNSIVKAMESFGGVVCGLGARDTLRTEMGYPLHGHELSLEISPVQAGATWAIGWNKSEFVGHDVLRKEKREGAEKKLQGLKVLGRGIPRAHMSVQDVSGAVVGEVTSGTFSPILKNGIALALVKTSFKVGDHLSIDIRGNICEVEIIKLPFVPSHVR